MKWLLAGLGWAGPVDPSVLRHLHRQAYVGQIGRINPHAAVFPVRLEGLAPSATVVVYGYPGPGDRYINRIAVIAATPAGAAVIVEVPIGSEGARDFALDEPSGVYEAAGGETLVVANGIQTPCDLEIYAWRGGTFKRIFSRGRCGSGGAVMKTRSGGPAFVIRNDWRTDRKPPDVYTVEGGKVRLAHTEFPQLYTPYLLPPDFLDHPERYGRAAIQSGVMALAYQGNTAEALRLADEIVARCYPAGAHKGGLAAAGFWLEVEASICVFAGRLREAENFAVRGERLKRCERAFGVYWREQIHLQSRDQVKIKHLAVDQEAHDNWMKETWESFSCPPESDDDRTLAWAMLGEACWKYLRLSDAQAYLRRAQAGIGDTEERAISEHVGKVNKSRSRPGSTRPAVTRDEWRASRPEEHRKSTQIEELAAQVKKAIAEW